MENNSLTLENLSCTRGGREVFSNLSFELNYGEALLVTGKNGAGKTSLLRQLAGLLPSAEVLTFANGAPLRDDLHFIGSLDGVKAHLTVAENLNFWRGLLDGSNTDQALRFWDLHELKDMPTRLLSSGQRRRLALARLLIAPRKLWLLDEPHAALDAQNQLRLMALLTRHLDEGGIAIIATHDALDLPRAKELQLDASETSAA